MPARASGAITAVEPAAAVVERIAADVRRGRMSAAPPRWGAALATSRTTSTVDGGYVGG